MGLWRFLRVLKAKQLWTLVKLGIANLLFVWPSLKATKKSIRIASENYGRAHHSNKPANAFRHALWNFLIARECLKWRRNEKSVLIWTKKITDLHEDLLPNEPLAKAMDLHNNAVGRNLIKMHRASSESELVLLLKSMTEKSMYVDDLKMLALQPLDQLTHIEHDDINEK